ncbi:helix-turn-helix transcriptional regulator [Caulobacter sp. SSI4214]|uniref:helix-turn-helix domain-containing protein n=1 Tax=Caulobacter sp. SSI4214 TaxID=2575739 RepID=UPI0019D657B6|nr:helix-turn-helix transcriptional regulator [Caulobacter sp. SSI4214]
MQLDRIRERMRALDLNPYSAARKAGLGESFVRDIMRNKVRHPSAERLSKLAFALECSLAYLLGEDEPDILWPEGKAPPPPLAIAETGNNAPPLKAVLLPIRFELMSDALRKATEISRPPLGWEAATIPKTFAGRQCWWEIVRDNTMEASAPYGSLVQVVEYTDDERELIADGDLVIITKRIAALDATYNFVERSMRRVTYRYPDMGLWFLEFDRNDPSQNLTMDVFREHEPTEPRKSYREIAMELEDPDERETALRWDDAFKEAVAKRASGPNEKIQKALDHVNEILDDPETTKRKLEEFDRMSPKLVGKVIRILRPTDPHAGFIQS